DDVLRLEVAVQDAGLVGSREAVEDLRGDAEDALDRRAFSREHGGERLPFDVLHREESVSRVITDIERANDVLVGDLPRELHLAPESLVHPRELSDLLLQHLERDDLVELAIARAIHGAHPTAPEQADELISPSEDRRPARTDRQLIARRPH